MMMLCSMIFSKAAAVENITLSVSPANVAIGDTVTVTVGTNSASPFVFWQVQLGFDSSKVQLATQATGTFTTFTGDSRPLATINSSGYVAIGGESSGTSLSGTGSLAIFTFTATASGSTSFDLRMYNASTQLLGTLLAEPVTYNFRMPAYTGNPAMLTVSAAVTPADQLSFPNSDNASGCGVGGLGGLGMVLLVGVPLMKRDRRTPRSAS
jgi:hypothetical protein